MKRLGLTLKQRVLLGLTVLVALLLTLAALSWHDVRQNRETIERMVHLDARKVSLANQITARLNAVARELYVLVEEDRPDLVEAFKRARPERARVITANLAELDRLVYRPEGKALLLKVRQQRELFVQVSSKIIELIDAGQAQRSVATTCAYCGVGCGFKAEMKGEQVVRMVPWKDGKANEGHACVKGRFAWGYATHKDRITRPMVRAKITDPWREVSWEEAYAHVASEFRRIQYQYGRDSVGGITSSRCTNEETYLVQKLVRAGFGNNNVDTCARVCHSPTGYGLSQTFGTSAGTQADQGLGARQRTPTETRPQARAPGGRKASSWTQGGRALSGANSPTWTLTSPGRLIVCSRRKRVTSLRTAAGSWRAWQRPAKLVRAIMRRAVKAWADFIGGGRRAHPARGSWPPLEHVGALDAAGNSGAFAVQFCAAPAAPPLGTEWPAKFAAAASGGA